jgi:hypothetical protein
VLCCSCFCCLAADQLLQNSQGIPGSTIFEIRRPLSSYSYAYVKADHHCRRSLTAQQTQLLSTRLSHTTK